MPQGTIKDYDPATRSGVLLQDDRSEVHIDVVSTEGSGLRYLRITTDEPLERVALVTLREAGILS